MRHQQSAPRTYRRFLLFLLLSCLIRFGRPAEWPETTRARFQHIVKDLLDGKLADVFIHGSSQLQSLKNVWDTWSSISSYTRSNSKFLIKIQEERYAF